MIICGFTNYFTEFILNKYLTMGSLQLALYSTTPFPGPGAPDPGVEVAGGGYLRQNVVFGSPFLDRAGNMNALNTNTITFPAPTAQWDTGMGLACGLVDMSSNQYTYSQIKGPGINVNPALSVGPGTPPLVFPVGSIQVVFNSLCSVSSPADTLNGIMNYWGLQILTDLFVGGSLYAGLLTAAASPSSPGTECTDATYARQAVTWLTPVVNAFTGATTGNSGALTFPNMTGSATIIGTAVYDASTSGHQLAFNNVLNLNGVATPAHLTAGQHIAFSAMDSGNLGGDQSHFQVGIAL